MNRPAASSATIPLVVFRVGGEDFAVDVFAVQEVLRYRAPTPVPKAPPFMEGVIEVRGVLVPVVDLRKRFEAPAPHDSDTRLLVIRLSDEPIGLVVDSVLEVLRANAADLHDPPAYVKGLAAAFLRGILRHGERLILVLDVERILSSDERIALERWANAQA